MTPAQADAFKHLGYEWWMFRTTYTLVWKLKYDGSVNPDPVGNALLESMIAHGRNLIDFFYVAKQRPTDWNVTDFGQPLASPLPLNLKEFRDNANKHMAHLTTDRTTPIKAWNSHLVSNAIAPLLDALKKKVAPIPPGWEGDLAQVSKILPI
jgi:hypothetical protein